MNQSSHIQSPPVPRGGGAAEESSALKTLLGSPEAKQLLTMLNAQNNAGSRPPPNRPRPVTRRR